MIPLFIHQKKHPWQDQQETFGENEYSSTVVLSSIRKMGKNPYNPRVTTVGRKLQMKHTKKCTKKKKARLKKKKKRKREKKLGIRNRRQSYFQGRKKPRKQQGKKKDCKASTNKARIEGKQNEEDFVREGSSQPPQK